jgi:hypothetical protein
MNQSQKGLTQFLIPRGNAPKLLEVVEEPFHLLTYNWLRVLDTAELAQIDQRVCQQLHAIMPLLDAFKAE